MDFVIKDVIVSKERGIIIAVNCGKDNVPKGGDEFSCGSDSWIVLSVADYDGYTRWLRVVSAGESVEPCRGFVLDKVEKK